MTYDELADELERVTGEIWEHRNSNNEVESDDAIIENLYELIKKIVENK